MASTTKALVLITGATGHLGFRTLVFALQAGYRVRIAIRRLPQSEKIKTAQSIKPYLDNVDFVEVPDITAPGAYDKAIIGIDHVLHIASPIPSNPDRSGSWQEIYYDPAVKGTLTMLEAASQNPGVQTVVVTSSVGVLEAEGRVGPEDLIPTPDAEALSQVDNHFQAYRTSKVLSHAAASEFVKAHDSHFRLIRVLPGYIQGPNELLARDEDFFSGSNEGTINAVLGNLAPFPKPTSQVFLDDAAKAHVLALDPARAKDGDVFIVAGNGGHSVSWDEVAALAAGRFPKAFGKGVLRAVKGQECDLKDYDVGSSEKALGFEFAGTEEMVEGLVAQYLRFHGHAAE